MVLSEEEKRLRKNAHQRKYYKNNVEKERTRVEKWQEDNREHYNEKARIRFAEYRKTPEGYKMTMVSRWKQMGLIGNYEKIWDYYLKIDKCEECECDFSVKGDGIGRFKCMDHSHITGEFRNVLCSKCNIKRR